MIDLTMKPLAALLLGGLAAGAAAQQPAPSPAQSAPRWAVDGSGTRCVLTRRLVGIPAATLVIRAFPGSGEYEVMLASPDWPSRVRLAKKEASLNLGPGGSGWQGSAVLVPLERGLGDAVAFPRLPARFLGAFGNATSISVAAGGEALGTYPLPSAAKAAEALAFCESEKMIEWGADPAGLEPGAAAPKPVGKAEEWLNERDLGPDQYLGSYAVAVIARLTVGPDGRVEQCDLLETSGSERLAGVACSALKSRARYEPARDKAGKPVRSVAVYRTGWSVQTEIRVHQ